MVAYSNAKRIVFVIHGLPMGGAEKFMISIVNHLYDISYAPVVVLLSNDDMLANEINPCVPIYKVLKSSRFDITVSKKIKKIIIDHGAKKIFCINPYSYFLTKISFLSDNNFQLYLSPHTTKPFSIYNWFQTFIYYRLIDKNDVVIYLCNKQKSYLSKKYLLPSSHHFVIYNGISTEKFNPFLFSAIDRNRLRSFYSVDNADKVILLVARINPEKRHIDAIKALSIIHRMKGVVKPHLIIVGSGNSNLEQFLQSTVKTLDLERYVHFAGNQSDVRLFYYISDIFTLTSESETFSIAALEAMAFGLPCVLTDVGGASEMIVKDWNGSLANPFNPASIANAWINALNNNGNGKAIRRFVEERFSLTKMLNQYVQVLSQHTT